MSDLDNRLHEISLKRNISWVDLYGGEIGALKKNVFYGMRDIIRRHYGGKINIITNFSMLHNGFFEKIFTYLYHMILKQEKSLIEYIKI